MEKDVFKKGRVNPPITALYIFLFCMFIAGTITLLNYYSVIDISKFTTDNIDTIPNLDASCPKTVEQMGKTCCKSTESGEMTAVVSAVYVNAKCPCPEPTTFLQIAPESDKIQICDCGCK
jgi:hypothetical protein